MRRWMTVLAVTLAWAAALSACSDKKDNKDSNKDTTASSPSDGRYSSTTVGNDTAVGAEEVGTGEISNLGTVLVDTEGYTLYQFKNDQGTTSSCTGACNDTWPAFTSEGDPTAGDGVDASKLTVVEQTGGVNQVAYNGHLLHTYSGDQAPGDANGQGFGNVWFAVTPAGEAAS